MASKNGKVCVTSMGPNGRTRTVCKKLSKKQIAKLIGLPKKLKKGWTVSHF